MKKIKIMYFVAGLKSGGVEQMLINYCSKMDKQRFEFVVVYQHEPVQACLDKITQAGCSTVRITARCDNFLKSVWDTYKVINEYKPDIIHSNMNLMNFIPNTIAKYKGIKVRISHSHIAEKGKGRAYLTFKLLCQKLIINSSNVFLACGSDAGTYLHGNKISSTLIHNAIDIDELSSYCVNNDKDECFKDKIVIGHAGRFTEQKNHKKLIDIFEAFLKKCPDAILLLAGTGELEDSIKQYVDKKKLTKQVIFLGVVSNMNQFYANVDLFLLPSLFEGFPVVALETQAAGVKSIFSDTIDPAVQITSLVTLMSIQKSNEAWADKMCQILQATTDDTENINTNLIKLRNAGYDVTAEVTKLQDIYLQALRCVCQGENIK